MMNIGFVSTRFSGTDGVTLETAKWAQVFQRSGHQCFWFAGELDRAASISYLAPEAHFSGKTNQKINAAVFGHRVRPTDITTAIHAQRRVLKAHLYRFLRKFKIDLLVAENVLSLPMQIPLALALTELLAETGMPAIAHHHDFTWERERYQVNGVGDFLQTAFPPRLPNIAHVVINSAAREELARRNGLVSTIVPNVLDFARPPRIDHQSVASFRQSIGLAPDDVMILQPTRVVQRKGIEHAIHLVRALKRPNCKLVVSHQAGDEGHAYADYLKDFAADQQVELIFVDAHLDDPWGSDRLKYPRFSLYDVYPGADFVTYPSSCEGFGNGLLEAIYFGKPVLVNRYPIFVRDIEPVGFDLVTMDGFLDRNAVDRVTDLLDHPEKAAGIASANYAIGRRHFSYEILRERINAVMAELPGSRFAPLTDRPENHGRNVIKPAAFENRETLEDAVARAKAVN